MQKDCPAVLDCDECMWWRTWRMTNEKTGQPKDLKRCSSDVLLEYLPHIVGTIDGVQTAANEARNRSVESKEATIALGQATLKSFEMIDKKIKQQDSILIEETK